MTDVRRKISEEIKLPIKVAVMGCVVNGPGECEGSDVAIFAGKGKGILYVQGELRQTVAEADMLHDCRGRDAHGKNRLAELHWYECHGVGRREMKIKRFLE